MLKEACCKAGLWDEASTFTETFPEKWSPFTKLMSDVRYFLSASFFILVNFCQNLKAISLSVKLISNFLNTTKLFPNSLLAQIS